MKLRQDITKIGTLGAVYTMGNAVSMALGILALPILTRFIAPGQMGIVRIAAEIIAPLAIIMNLGIVCALRNRFFKTEGEDRTSFVRSLLVGVTLQMTVLGTALSLLGFWLAPILLPNLPLGEHGLIILWLLIVWGAFAGCMELFGTRLAELSQRAGLSVSIRLVHAVTQVALGIVAVAVLGWQGLGRQATIFAGGAVACIWSFALSWRWSRGHFDASVYRETLPIGLGFVPHLLAGVLVLAINSWMLTKMGSAELMGIYGTAVLFARVQQMPITALDASTYPTIVAYMRDGSEKARRQHSRLLVIILSGVLALSLLTYMFVPVAIRLLTAPSYHLAAKIVPVLAVAWCFAGVYMIMAQHVHYQGGGTWLSLASIPALIVSVALGWLLIPIWGAYGAAVALLGCFIVRAATVTAISQHLYRLPMRTGELLRVIACGAVLATADSVVAEKLSLPLAVGAKFLLLAMFVPLLMFSGVMNKSELRTCLQMVFGRLQSRYGESDLSKNRPFS